MWRLDRLKTAVWLIAPLVILAAWQPAQRVVQEIEIFKHLAAASFKYNRANSQNLAWISCALPPEPRSEFQTAFPESIRHNLHLLRLAGQAGCLQGDYQAAAAFYEAVLALDPGDSHSKIQLLAVYQRNGDRAGIDQLLLSGGLPASLLLQAADIHLRASRLPEALTWLGWAARLEPSQPGVWAGWLSAGGKYEAAQDYPAALRTYHQALAAQEQAGVSLYRGSLYLRVGRVLARQAETRPGAIHYFNWALAGGGFQSETERAQAHEARGGWYRAYRPAYAVGLYRADFEQALAINPNSAGALLNLGIVYLEDLKDPLAARAVFERGAALHPANASFPYYLGLAHRALGQRAAAQTAFERALELRPGWQSAETQLDLLRAAP